MLSPISNPEAEVASRIQKFAMKRCTPDSSDMDLDLMVEYELDSLDMARLVLELEDEIGVNVTDKDVKWNEINSPRKLANLFARYLQEK